MKETDLLTLALAGVAVWMIWKTKPAAASAAAGISTQRIAPQEPFSRTRFYTAIPWVDPQGYGGLGGLNRDYLETDARGVSIIP